MQLYRMELYKLLHKRIFMAGVPAAIGLMLVYFWFVEVEAEVSVIDGQVYSGYEAVQINQKITAEFEGEITNEKISQIIEKYGLPTRLEENLPGWRDGNYLNDFVTRYFTDGCWETGTLPTEIYLLEETQFGKAYEAAGTTPYFAYTTGWRVFSEMLQFGLVLGSVLVVCGISIAFAEETQTKMLPLIFTTAEGRKKDIAAKVLASFTVTILIFMGILLINFLLCQAVYGLNGYEGMSGTVLSEEMFGAVYSIPFSKYMSILLSLGLQALLSLCAITLCASAHHNSTFGAVITSAVCFIFPVVLRMFFGGVIWIIVNSMPVFLIMKETFSDIYVIWYVVLAINIFISAGCLLKGTVYYKTRQYIN